VRAGLKGDRRVYMGEVRGYAGGVVDMECGDEERDEEVGMKVRRRYEDVRFERKYNESQIFSPQRDLLTSP
jgi:hypothetical protein